MSSHSFSFDLFGWFSFACFQALNTGNWDEIFSVRLFTNEVIMARCIYLVKSPLLFHAIGLLFRNEQVIVARCIYLVKSPLLFHGISNFQGLQYFEEYHGFSKPYVTESFAHK